MKFSLIVCTYHRPEALQKLLDSVTKQSLYPSEILIIDGSYDNKTDSALQQKNYPRLKYFKVDEKHRGLTRQRNFGIGKVSVGIEVICFLDDDIILTNTYFEVLLKTYRDYPDALGVGGFIVEEGMWRDACKNKANFGEFEMDGWKRKLGSRNVLRKKLGLLSDKPPGFMPEFSNGLSIGFLPPSGKTYPVEFFMGGVSSYRKEIFDTFRFSGYFEGYGLYEDMDFCLRISKLGQLYVNTSARLFHHHDEAGRPNKFQYGKMVVRNGWYVWRVKYPRPSMRGELKWHAIIWLLSIIRLGNVINTNKKKEAFTEALGRILGWWSLLYSKPKII